MMHYVEHIHHPLTLSQFCGAQCNIGYMRTTGDGLAYLPHASVKVRLLKPRTEENMILAVYKSTCRQR